VEIDPSVLKAGERFLRGPCRSVQLYPLTTLRFDSGALFVDSAWRVLREGAVVASSDANQERLASSLVGASLKSLASKRRYHDLVLVFDNDAVLETSDTTDEFEYWRIVGTEPDELIVGGPGELWSSFIREEKL
jgi:hypothetical protein